jgi:hypothetical protein
MNQFVLAANRASVERAAAQARMEEQRRMERSRTTSDRFEEGFLRDEAGYWKRTAEGLEQMLMRFQG